MRKAKQSDTKRLSVVVTTDLKQALQAVATKEGRSLSGLVNIIVAEYIKKNAG